MNDRPLLDRQTIMSAFRLLATRLQRKGAVADVYLFGGGAMVVAFNEREATRDLDARFTSTGQVLREVQAVADEMNLPQWWLNEQGTSYLPRDRDPNAVSVFDHPNLRVLRASDRHLLAMKAAASRRNTKDIDDLATLALRLGLETPDEVIRVHGEVFGDVPLSAAKVEVIREALGSRSQIPTLSSLAVSRCRVCGRVLRSPESVASGIGPICATRGIA